MFDKKMLKDNIILIIGLVFIIVILAVVNIFISGGSDYHGDKKKGRNR